MYDETCHKTLSVCSFSKSQLTIVLLFDTWAHHEFYEFNTLFKHQIVGDNFRLNDRHLIQ